MSLLENRVETSVHSDESQTSGFKTPTDYTIVAANIFSGSMSPVNVKDMIIELSYFEDMFGCVVSGNCVIHDAQNIMSSMQFNGNEYIRISFGKTDDNCIDKMFRIYKCSTRNRSVGTNQESYIIYFCSDELVLSEQSRVSKSYSGKTIKFIINDILKNYLLVDENIVNENSLEDTKGVYDFVIPNMKPFEAIHYVSQYATSAYNPSIVHDMVFYENRYGYIFVSLATLFKQTIYYSYDQRPKNMPESKYTDPVKFVNNIISFKILNSFDTLTDSINGKSANKTMSIDPLLRSVKSILYNSVGQQAMGGTLNSGPTNNNLKNRFGKTQYENYDSNIKTVIGQNSRENNEFIKNTQQPQKNFNSGSVASQRSSLMNLINTNRVKVVVGGDPNITVGRVVELNIYETGPNSGENVVEPDPQYSGKYLISAVRHLMNGTGYYTIMECIKDSMSEPYNNVNNNSEIIKQVTSGKM